MPKSKNWKLRNALHAVILLAIVNLAAGFGLIFTSGSNKHVVGGLIFGILAVFVARASWLALGIAVGLYCYDLYGWLTMSVSGEITLPTWIIVMRVALLLIMLQGFLGIRELASAPTIDVETTNTNSS
jgi:hypothetical protein